MAYHIPDDLIQTARREWQAAGGNDKNAVLQRYADVVGCSVATIRRRVTKGMKPTKSLAGCAQAEKAVPDYVIDIAEDMIERGYALNPDGRRLSARRMIEKMERRGVPPEHIPSASTLNRRINERGHNHRRRRRIVEAEVALQRVQIDFSRSEHFQYKRKTKDGTYVLRVSPGSHAYKDNNQALRTWVCSAIDDYSRMHYARIYMAAGESGALGLQFLNDLLTPDPDDGRPERHFFHLAHLYQTDRGAFNTQSATATALDAVGSQLKAATKEGQGKVENRFKHIWRDFELDLAEDMGLGAEISLDELNDLLRDWSIEEGRTRKHPRRPTLTREQAYLMSIRDYPPVILDDPDMLRIAFRTDTRDVDGNGNVSLDKILYRVPKRVDIGQGKKANVPPGTKLTVMPNLQGEVRAVLFDQYSAPFVLTPYEQPAFGDLSDGDHAHASDAVVRRIDPRESGADATRRHLEAAGIVPRPPAADAPDAPAQPTNVTSLFGAGVTPERRVPDSPFLQVGPGHDRLSAFAAKVHVGRRLESVGRTYADVAYAFDDLVAGTPDAPGVSRADLDAAVDFFITTHRQQAV